MRSVIVLNCLLLSMAPTIATAKTTKPPKEKFINCNVKKDEDDKIRFKCTDGSIIELPEPTPAPQPIVAAPEEPSKLHVKDAFGSEYKNLIHVNVTGSGHVLLNTTSGNLLEYDGAGVLQSAGYTLYESADCTGTAYAIIQGSVLKNKVLSAPTAWPNSLHGAMKITGFVPGNKLMRSKWVSGECLSVSQSLSKIPIVEPADLDAQDLPVLNLPLELVESK